MSYLLVVAHPDDEVLGAGGAIYQWGRAGEEVNVCILSSQAKARAFRPSDELLQTDMKESAALLGVKRVIAGTYENIKMNVVPHLDMVRFIEKAITDTGADVILTHHPSDLNNDHLHTSLACQEAARLFQRRSGVRPLKELLFMEVPSATEWSVNRAFRPFTPNTYVEIGEEGLNKKIEALSLYRGVMRDYPHPRSGEAMRGLAAFRGGQAGLYYAEAFESVFRRTGAGVLRPYT